jgi:hypothetical protein
MQLPDLKQVCIEEALRHIELFPNPNAPEPQMWSRSGFTVYPDTRKMQDGLVVSLIFGPSPDLVNELISTRLDFDYRPETPAINLYNFRLHKSLWGKGLSKSLLEVFNSISSRMGCMDRKSVHIMINPSFWEHIGYQKIPEMPAYWREIARR